MYMYNDDQYVKDRLIGTGGGIYIIMSHRRKAMSLGLQGRIMITAHRTFVSGCEGPS
jgi:hypothetical protein